MTTPLWRQIRDALAAEIEHRRYAAGAKLPSEAALGARFGVNRHTVRQALAAMRDQGLVYSRRGAGVFVTRSPVSYPLGRETRFTRNLSQSGRESHREILRLEQTAGTRAETAALEIPKGAEVHVMECRGFVDDAVVTYARSVFPAKRLPRFAETLAGTRSITEALGADGVVDYWRRGTRISALRASGQVARHLELPEGAPVISTLSLNADIDGAPVEYGQTWFNADLIEFVVGEDDFG